MKTTIDIADPLFERARRVAARDGTTLRALVEAGLRHVLAERECAPSFTLRDASVGGQGLQAGAPRASIWREVAHEACGRSAD